MKVLAERAAVLAVSAADQIRAETLAQSLGLPLLEPGTAVRDCAGRVEMVLLVSGNDLALQLCGRLAPGPVRIDFGDPAMRYRRRGGQNELLGRAVGALKRPGLSVLDATAGLGRDAFVLADLGCSVQLCERNELIACLLQQALQQACHSADPWLSAVTARMRLHRSDARELAAQNRVTQVIYLDPMFPSRQKSAAVKKEMVLFQALLGEAGDESDSEALLRWALLQDVARVVVKRPAKAAPLGGRKPSHQVAGKAVRFDVHVLRALQ